MTIGPAHKHTHYYVCTLTQNRCALCGHIQGTYEGSQDQGCVFEFPETTKNAKIDQNEDEKGQN